MYCQDRKHPRLKNYDYSQNGYYYVTFCTADKVCTLGRVGTSGPEHNPAVYLSPMGMTVKKYIDRIDSVYAGGGLGAGRPTVPTIVRSVKAMVSRELGVPIWQTSFYEHVIRSRESYEEIYSYISGNPGRWLELGGTEI